MSTPRMSSLTPPRSVSPPAPAATVQPDHFFGADGTLLPSPNSDARPWLHPDDDPLAHRGIPVFKPTMDEFADFEAYMTRIESWGLKSGIVKVIPPKQWVDALPSIKDQLAKVKIRSPIEQHMLGRGGLFRQENVEKRRNMSVREWAELCSKQDFRAPGVDDVGLHARGTRAGPRPARRARPRAPSHKAGSPEPEEAPLKEELASHTHADESRGEYMSPPTSVGNPRTPTADLDHPPSPGNDGDGACPEDDPDHLADADADRTEEKPKTKGKRSQTRQAREAQLAARAAKDAAFMQVFDPDKDWLPPGTTPSDYTIEFCQKLERQYWRNCGFGAPAWYGADSQGSLYTDETKIWNVAHLPSFLSRLLPSSSNSLPGVNLPYLYFGMWRATFAWHVEDMDLFSINYIHFGAPKFWYAVPQGRAAALESTMKSYFPKDTSQCPQFLRHKSFLASPTLLAQSSCRPNFLVQREHEFVITYPRGYHAGFNLGFNCAESVNFALESWIELGRKAKACQCVTDSVRIDVDQLLRDMHNREAGILDLPVQPPSSSKRKAEGVDGASKRKRPKPFAESGLPNSAPHSKVSVTLKLGPKPPEPESFPCCLCVSMLRDGLLRVQDPPVGKRELPESLSSVYDASRWMAHEECAKVVPETWVDVVDSADILPDGSHVRESRVFGVDAIVKDRWSLKCSACTKGRQKAHGAPIQCTKGKCTKSFHVSCAREGQNGVSYTVLREVEKEVILVDVQPASSRSSGSSVTPGEFLAENAQPTVDTEPRVLKTIKKNEVQVLCNQHNPAVAAAKKANKQDKIRNELLALPSMSRIKIRVSAGVFEVSLVRVIEDSKSIEVLWDRGIKREFKWGSVVFGQTDDQTVMQKPSEPAPEPAPQRTKEATPTLHVATFPSAVSSSGSSTSTSTPTPAPAHMYVSNYQYQAPSTMYGTGSWPYQTSQPPPQQIPYSVAYAYGYYPATMAAIGRPPAENAGAQGTYCSQLQWQQSCAGPRTNSDPTESSGQAYRMQS